MEAFLFRERWKSVLGGSATGESSPRDAAALMSVDSSIRNGAPFSRQSRALDQFFAPLRDRAGLSLLDFAGASQETVSYITGLGHRLYSEDYLRSLDQAFGDGDFFANQSQPGRMEEFMKGSLDFPSGHFAGALAWDALQFMASPLLESAVERLYDILHPNSYLFAIFHADERMHQVPLHHYRVQDAQTLLITPRGHRQQAQFFNNRRLEKLFDKFQSVKFFLTRDSLREVIVRR